MQPHFKSSIILKSQKVEITWMPIDGWMDKVVYTYQRLHSAVKRNEILIYTTKSMSLENMLSETIYVHKTNIVRLYDFTYMS